MGSLDQVHHTLLLLLHDVPVPHPVPSNVSLPVNGVEVIILAQPWDVLRLAHVSINSITWLVRHRPTMSDVQEIIIRGAGLGHVPGRHPRVHDGLVGECVTRICFLGKAQRILFH